MTMDPLTKMNQRKHLLEMPIEECDIFLDVLQRLKVAVMDEKDVSKVVELMPLLMEKVEKFPAYSTPLKVAAVFIFRDPKHKGLALAAFQKSRLHSVDPRERMDSIIKEFQKIEL